MSQLCQKLTFYCMSILIFKPRILCKWHSFKDMPDFKKNFRFWFLLILWIFVHVFLF